MSTRTNSRRNLVKKTGLILTLALSCFLGGTVAASSQQPEPWTFRGPYGEDITHFLFGSQASPVYATSDQSVYRSNDGGAHWKRLNFKGRVKISSTTGVLYGADQDIGFYRSSDHGITWQLMSTREVGEFVPASGNPAIIYEIAIPGIYSYGFYRSTDSGKSWVHKSTIYPSLLTHLFSDPSHDNTVYVTRNDNQVLKSTNGGNTWKSLYMPMEAGYTGILAVSPSSSNTLYVSGASRNGGQRYVMKSTDGGTTWSIVLKEACSQSDYNCVFNSITVDSKDANHAALTDTKGVRESQDGGRSWTRPAVPNQFSYEVLEFRPGRRYLGTNGAGVYVSVDQGRTWSVSNQGMDGIEVYNLEAGPDGSGKIFAAGSGRWPKYHFFESQDRFLTWKAVTLPVDRMYVYDIETQHGNPGLVVIENVAKLLFSADAGVTWSLGSKLSGPGNIELHSQDPDVIYSSDAYVYGGSVEKSTDKGRTWKSITPGPVGQRFYGLSVDPQDGNHLYVASSGSAGFPGNPEFYRTHNGGESWDAVPPAPGKYFGGTAIDPGNSNRVYVATTDNGIYHTQDDGHTWTFAAVGNVSDGCCSRVLVAPSNPVTVYAISSTNAIFESQDYGLSWMRVDMTGLRSEQILDLLIDPADDHLLYVGTFHGIFSAHR